MRRRILATAVTMTAAMVLAGAALAADPVRIGVAAPFTGAAAGYGRDAKMGAEMAAAEINAAGGILGGRQIELVYEDDKGTPQGGVAAVQKLMSEHRVQAITGGTNSLVVLAETSVTKNRILQVNAAAQADAITEQGSKWLFQINNTASANSEAFNGYITGTLKPKTVAYMGENSEFSKALLAGLRKSLDAAGIPLVNVATYDANITDFTSIISKVKASEPELLYVADAYPARSAQLWKQIRQQGGFPVETQAPGVVQASMLTPAEGAMDGVITGDIFIAEGNTGPMADFVEAFRKSHQAEPNKVHLVTYEAVQVIARAMDKAGSADDYDLIAKTIRTNPWPSPRGELTFDDRGRARAPQFYIHEVKDGRLTLRETIENR